MDETTEAPQQPAASMNRDIRYKCYNCGHSNFTINGDRDGLRFDCNYCGKPSGTTEVEDYIKVLNTPQKADTYSWVQLWPDV